MSGIKSQWGDKSTRDDIETLSRNRGKDVDSAKLAIDNKNNKTDITEKVETSAFAIGASWMKTGVNKMRMAFNSATGDTEELKYLQEKEKLNKSARKSMVDSYSTKNLLEDALDAAMIVGTVAAIATGAGAVAIGLGVASRVVAKQLAKKAIETGVKQVAVRGGIVETLGNAATTIARKTIETPEARKAVIDSIAKGMSSGSSITKNLVSPITSAARVAKPYLGLSAKTFGVASVPLSVMGMGAEIRNRAEKSVVKKGELDDAVKSLDAKGNTKPTVRDVLNEKNSRTIRNNVPYDYKGNQRDRDPSKTGLEGLKDIKEKIDKDTTSSKKSENSEVAKTKATGIGAILANNAKNNAQNSSITPLSDSIMSNLKSLLKKDETSLATKSIIKQTKV